MKRKLYHRTYTSDTHTEPDNDKLCILLLRLDIVVASVPFLGTLFHTVDSSHAVPWLGYATSYGSQGADTLPHFLYRRREVR